MRSKTHGLVGIAMAAIGFALVAFRPPPEPTAPPGSGSSSPIANMIQANVAPNVFQGFGSSSEASGGLTLHCNPVRCSHAWTGDAWTLSLTDNGGGVIADVYYWRPLPAQWRNKPLRIADNGPPALAAELQIGAWSSRTGNRIDPPPADDGTNGSLRARRKIDLEPGQVAEWSIVILGECQREDLDGSGTVDATDLSLLLGAWGLKGPRPEDINGDKIVDATDHALLLGAWSPPKPGADG